MTDRFNQAFVQLLAAMERLIVNAANGEDYSQQMDDVMGSIFRKDFDCQKLQSQVAMLPDVVCEVLPDVKKVTSVRTVCSAMCASSHRDMFSELHKLDSPVPDCTSDLCNIRKSIFNFEAYTYIFALLHDSAKAQ